VKADYTWPLYGIGYLLTMVGAMLAFDDQLLGIVVLALNAVVYASSAYIFRQPFWLYLSNVLIPVIALLSLHYNQKLTAPWVSGIFMGLAYLYLFVGLLFERNKDEAKEGISPFALTFFAPGLFHRHRNCKRGEDSSVDDLFLRGCILCALCLGFSRVDISLPGRVVGRRSLLSRDDSYTFAG